MSGWNVLAYAAAVVAMFAPLLILCLFLKEELKGRKK
jgi:hypothetical protein